MKKILIIFMILLIFSVAAGQVPDDFVPGLRPLTEEDYEYLESLPRLDRANFSSRELPSSVDNSTHEWLRPVFSQDGGSCGQASGIGYVFTYEINRLRGLASDTEETQYPDHYTWNFLNGGYGGGSWYYDGWQIVETGGCPTIEEYGGIFAYGQTGWMDGYDNYRSAMGNRIDEIFAIEVGTPEGLENLKYWFYEHGNEEESGGLVCFGAGVSNLQQYELPAESPFAGELIITDWTQPVNHAMTFVGYDDSVRYDYNGDGQFTNDIDINNDGETDMRDWEIGAVKMLNSWGTNWGNEGFCWVMYRTLAEPNPTGGISGNVVHCITAREEYEPLLTLKTTISHDLRNTIRLGAGVSSTNGAQQPEMELIFPHFNFQGGEWNMPGNMLPGAQPLEIGFDITPLLSGIEPDGDMSWWLVVESEDPSYAGNGVMVNYSIIDETSGNEYVCDQSNWGIISDWANYFGINADIDVQTVEILTEELPAASEGIPYEFQMLADFGNEPYCWTAVKKYLPMFAFDQDFPVVNWEPITVTDNDDGLAVIDLPFEFRFYGELYDQVTFLTDGSIKFADGFTYIRSEENIKANRCITVHGTDLMAYPEFGDGFYYFEDTNRVLFRWTVSRYDQPDYDADFALSIYEDGYIEFHYNTDAMSNDSNWAAGISAGDGISYHIAGISGEFDIPADEVWGFSQMPYPHGIELSPDGFLSGSHTLGDRADFNLTIRVTDDLGIYDEEIISFTVNSLSEDNDLIKPSIMLSQNHPNPFITNSTRSETIIDFEISESAKTRLDIYNLKGEHVSTLINEGMQAGSYQAAWNGKNKNNMAAASGVYFYKLQNGKQSVSRKLLLVK